MKRMPRCMRCALLAPRRWMFGLSVVLVRSSGASPGLSVADVASGTAVFAHADALSNRSLDEEIAATRKLLELLQTRGEPQLPLLALDVPSHDVSGTYDQITTAVPSATQFTQVTNPVFPNLPSSVETLEGKISLSRSVASMVREENAVLEKELIKFRSAAGRVAQREEDVNNLLQQHISAGLPRATSPLVTPPSMLQTISSRSASVSLPLNSTHGVSIAVRFIGFAVTVMTVALVCGWAKFQDGCCKLPPARSKSNLAIYGATANVDMRGRARGATTTSTAVNPKLQSGGLPINRVMKTSLNLRTNPGLQAGTVDEDEAQVCEP